MIFKNVQASMPLYILDRANITITQDKVTSVIPPHVDLKMGGKMVVDVTTSNRQTYTIEDGLSIAYFGNMVISLDMESILREVESIESNSRQILEDIDKHKDIVDKCLALLVEHNPTLKERKENEERFACIEGKIDKLATMMEKLMS